jgi:hypothetical protein
MRVHNGIDINAEVERRGRAIMETDGSAPAVVEAMRGCHRLVFDWMDSRDNFYPVPAWHSRLRRARNARISQPTHLFDVLTPLGGAS